MDEEPTCWTREELEEFAEEYKEELEYDDKQDGGENDERINGIKETVDVAPLVELHESSSELVAPQKVNQFV